MTWRHLAAAVAALCAVMAAPAARAQYDPGDRYPHLLTSNQAERPTAARRTPKRAHRKVAKLPRAAIQAARTLDGYGKTLAAGIDRAAASVGGSKAEQSLSSELRGVVADLRSRHGAGSVTVAHGYSYRRVRGSRRMSCHSTGDAFDGRLSAAALSTARANPRVGIITYSGAMHHVHVSVCARERGIRTHLVVNGSGVPVKYARKKKGARYATAR